MSGFDMEEVLHEELAGDEAPAGEPEPERRRRRQREARERRERGDANAEAAGGDPGAADDTGAADEVSGGDPDPWGEALLAADPAPDIDDRVLCPDGACVGIIAPDGRCTECGAEAAPEPMEDDAGEPSPFDGIDPEADDDPWEAAGEGGDDEPPSLDDRVLCPDGACIGVIGPDGRCKECGAEA